ncbi:hypothetical protein PG993_012461 [Apiospora rasikravindrae]|uniref:Uncharacterized protein n=1 Tax=Apiospora rasikravindrae TaxID=990691 RepID=A0ABR1S3X7_9PEZI
MAPMPSKKVHIRSTSLVFFLFKLASSCSSSLLLVQARFFLFKLASPSSSFFFHGFARTWVAEPGVQDRKVGVLDQALAQLRGHRVDLGVGLGVNDGEEALFDFGRLDNSVANVVLDIHDCMVDEVFAGDEARGVALVAQDQIGLQPQRSDVERGEVVGHDADNLAHFPENCRVIMTREVGREVGLENEEKYVRGNESSEQVDVLVLAQFPCVQSPAKSCLEQKVDLLGSQRCDKVDETGMGFLFERNHETNRLLTLVAEVTCGTGTSNSRYTRLASRVFTLVRVARRGICVVIVVVHGNVLGSSASFVLVLHLSSPSNIGRGQRRFDGSDAVRHWGIAGQAGYDGSSIYQQIGHATTYLPQKLRFDALAGLLINLSSGVVGHMIVDLGVFSEGSQVSPGADMADDCMGKVDVVINAVIEPSEGLCSALFRPPFRHDAVMETGG